MTILEKIKDNAKRLADQLVYREQLLSEERILTWRELDEQSDRLAFYLNDNLKTKTPIIVYGHKDPYMLVCFLACVKSGRAYCPIDVNVPTSRVEAIVEEVNPEIVLCTEDIAVEDDRIRDRREIYAMISSTNELISGDCFVDKEDVFYIIFTSGSTGTPKGVQITRDCLDNFIAWAITLGDGIPVDARYTFINQAPFSFDLSVMDLYLCLYTGGTLWALTKEVQENIRALYKSLGNSNADVWVSTPSFADVCLSDPMFSEKLMDKVKSFL